MLLAEERFVLNSLYFEPDTLLPACPQSGELHADPMGTVGEHGEKISGLRCRKSAGAVSLYPHPPDRQNAARQKALSVPECSACRSPPRRRQQKLSGASDTSLTPFFPYPARLLVIDNGSTDGSCELAERTPGVEVIRMGENRGFCEAVNTGIRAPRIQRPDVPTDRCRIRRTGKESVQSRKRAYSVLQ